MKKLALALSALGFLAFTGIAHAQDQAGTTTDQTTKTEKAPKKHGKKMKKSKTGTTKEEAAPPAEQKGEQPPTGQPNQ